VRYSHLDIARLLVERGASVAIAQPDGTTALMIASGVKYAITQEGDPDNSGSPDDAYEIVKLLADKGADLNTTNAKGETALYGAAFAGRDRVIQFLADHGARVDAKTRTGYTILDGALNTGVADEGTGSRTGGKPGEPTVALVKAVMIKAGVPPTFTASVQRESIHAETSKGRPFQGTAIDAGDIQPAQPASAPKK
jgi:hypothetical protein